MSDHEETQPSKFKHGTPFRYACEICDRELETRKELEMTGEKGAGDQVRDVTEEISGELLPCPFCGSSPTTEHDDRIVECINCGFWVVWDQWQGRSESSELDSAKWQIEMDSECIERIRTEAYRLELELATAREISQKREELLHKNRERMEKSNYRLAEKISERDREIERLQNTDTHLREKLSECGVIIENLKRQIAEKDEALKNASHYIECCSMPSSDACEHALHDTRKIIKKALYPKSGDGGEGK